MAKQRTVRIPKHRCHKSHHRGYVYSNGRQWWTAKWETPAANYLYDIFVSLWLQGGRTTRNGLTPQVWKKKKVEILADFESEGDDTSLYLVRYLIQDFMEFAKVHYRRDGMPTSEVRNIENMVRPLLEDYADIPAAMFRPQDLVKYRAGLIQQGLARSQINKQAQVLRRIFKYGVSQSTVPSSVLEALRAVEPLRRGRSQARETEPIRPVQEEEVWKVLPHLPKAVSAMVQVQWYSGMRPGEVVQMRGHHIDQSGTVWIYRPPRHKTQHYGHERVVYLGEKAQGILNEWLVEKKDAPLFPSLDVSKCGKEVKQTYSTQSYGRALRRACVRIGIKPWNLNQLRHSAATRIAQQFGIENARVILGHASISTTQIYAEIDRKKAIEVMESFG